MKIRRGKSQRAASSRRTQKSINLFMERDKSCNLVTKNTKTEPNLMKEDMKKSINISVFLINLLTFLRFLLESSQ